MSAARFFSVGEWQVHAKVEHNIIDRQQRGPLALSLKLRLKISLAWGASVYRTPLSFSS